MTKFHKTMLLLATIPVAFLLAACDPVQPSTAQKNAQMVEDNQQRLQSAQPAPRLDVSLERSNLSERLVRLNKQNAQGYVTLIDMGRVVASFPVRGKVTSLNAYLQSSWRTERYNDNPYEIEQPDLDGAYGKNDDGIFFFTADTNTYVEWKGSYLYTDAPLALNGMPLMTREVK
jgi:hypothetical protein